MGTGRNFSDFLTYCEPRLALELGDSSDDESCWLGSRRALEQEPATIQENCLLSSRSSIESRLHDRQQFQIQVKKEQGKVMTEKLNIVLIHRSGAHRNSLLGSS
jgi:hypothetical protein